MYRSFLLLALAPVASAQITFPTDQPWGYSIRAEAVCNPGGVDQDSAFNFGLAAPGATSVFFSDGVSPFASHNSFSQGPEGCATGIGLSVGADPTGTWAPETQHFELNATTNSIDFDLLSETMHNHSYRDECGVGPEGITRETVPSGVFFVPFLVAQTSTMTLQDLTVLNLGPTIIQSGNGVYTPMQSSSVTLELYIYLANPDGSLSLFLVGSIDDQQFAGPFSLTLPGATNYALVVRYEQAESLRSQPVGISYSVDALFQNSVNMEIDFTTP